LSNDSAEHIASISAFLPPRNEKPVTQYLADGLFFPVYDG
jgi:hypothetical protein